MEDRETARMNQYGESKMTQIMMATVPHVTSGLGLTKFQADGFLLTRVYNRLHGPQIWSRDHDSKEKFPDLPGIELTPHPMMD